MSDFAVERAHPGATLEVAVRPHPGFRREWRLAVVVWHTHCATLLKLIDVSPHDYVRVRPTTRAREVIDVGDIVCDLSEEATNQGHDDRNDESGAGQRSDLTESGSRLHDEDSGDQRCGGLDTWNASRVLVDEPQRP